jgi:hypothetical protein
VVTMAVALPTVEGRLRAQILDLERERDEWKEDAKRYRAYWQAVVEQCEEHGKEIAELRAALARLGLRMQQ